MKHRGVSSPHPAPVATKEAEVERSETSVSEGAEGAGCGPRPVPTPVVVADPEVTETARRRQFSAEYKLRIVEEADGCTEPGEIGELLRREGLYSSAQRQLLVCNDDDYTCASKRGQI